MPVDAFQSRVRWTLSIFLLAFYLCWIFLGIVFVVLGTLLNQPFDPHKQAWAFYLIATMSMIGAASASRIYWKRSIRRGRLKRGLCIQCGNQIGIIADTCPKCGKEQPRGKVRPPSAFPVLPVQEPGEDKQ
jgi:ribosomal protein L40E